MSVTVSVPAGRSQRYLALVSQAGTAAPVATVLFNGLSAVPVWTRAGAGDYRLTLVGAFPANQVALHPLSVDAGPATSGALTRLSADVVKLAASADGVVTNWLVYIEVFL
jgi:hypothetical protein